MTIASSFCVVCFCSVNKPYASGRLGTSMKMLTRFCQLDPTRTPDRRTAIKMRILDGSPICCFGPYSVRLIVAMISKVARPMNRTWRKMKTLNVVLVPRNTSETRIFTFVELIDVTTTAEKRRCDVDSHICKGSKSQHV